MYSNSKNQNRLLSQNNGAWNLNDPQVNDSTLRYYKPQVISMFNQTAQNSANGSLDGNGRPKISPSNQARKDLQSRRYVSASNQVPRYIVPFNSATSNMNTTPSNSNRMMLGGVLRSPSYGQPRPVVVSLDQTQISPLSNQHRKFRNPNARSQINGNIAMKNRLRVGGNIPMHRNITRETRSNLSNLLAHTHDTYSLSTTQPIYEQPRISQHFSQQQTFGNIRPSPMSMDIDDKISSLSTVTAIQDTRVLHEIVNESFLAPVSRSRLQQQGQDLALTGDTSIIEVGVSEDANPRWRPSMEDEHIIRVDFNPATPSTTNTNFGYRTGPVSPTSMADSFQYGISDPKIINKSLQANSEKNCFFAIYDGHGGRACVNYIKNVLHCRFASYLQTCASVSDAIIMCCQDVDKDMANAYAYQQTGSTVALCYVRSVLNEVTGTFDRMLYCGNVGDARAVIAFVNKSASPTNKKPPRFGNNVSYPILKCKRLTYDHVATDAAEAVRVKKNGGFISMGRVNGVLQITRAMGDYALKRSGVSATPYISSLNLTSGYQFLILACDGLWDVFTDQEAVDAVSSFHYTSGPSLSNASISQIMSDHLLRLALTRGTTDNVTVMVVRFRTGQL